MLESVKRAYDRSIFNEDNLELCCPVNLDVIELYIQILKPAYLLSLSLQLTHTSICDTIPSILQLILQYRNITITGTAKRLCTLLISTLNQKFAYELQSQTYKTASILKVPCLKFWLGRPWSKGSLSAGLESILPVAESFKKFTTLPEEAQSVDVVNVESNASTPILKTPASASQSGFNKRFFPVDFP